MAARIFPFCPDMGYGYGSGTGLAYYTRTQNSEKPWKKRLVPGRNEDTAKIRKLHMM